MITIAFDLLFNKYGAKPWVDSNYSGTVEVPPSPARIIRAIANGMFKELESQGLRPAYDPSNKDETHTDIPLPEDWICLLKKLSSENPSFYIPPHTYNGAQTFAAKNEIETFYQRQRGERIRSLVDSYIVFDASDRVIYAQYDVDLNESETKILNLALDNIGYLGRSEYVCEATTVKILPEDKEFNCFPDENGLIVTTGVGDGNDSVDWLLKSNKEIRMLGYPRNPGLQMVSYTLQKSTLKKEVYKSNRQIHSAVLDVHTSRPIHNDKGVVLTDLLHKTLVKLNDRSVKFTGYMNGEPAPEHKRAWYYWKSDSNKVIQLVVCANEPFTPDELSALKKVRALYSTNLEARVRLLGLSTGRENRSCEFETETPALLYQLPREGKLYRSPEAQIINTIHWSLNGQGEKLKEFDINDNIVSTTVPNIGLVSVKINSVVGNVITSRGKRKSPVDFGFHFNIQTETPVDLISVGFNRNFGMGKLKS